MKNFYAVRLNSTGSGTSRWALYTITEKQPEDKAHYPQMDPLWPKRPDIEDGKRELLPNQVFYKGKNFPAYHFVASGYGISHLDKIAYNLAQHFKESVTIHELHGHYPSSCIQNYNGG